MDEVVNIAGKYQHRCNRQKVLPSSFWNKARADAAEARALEAERRAGSQEGPAVPAGAAPQDQTGAGGGTIGTGVAPVPGEEGFSGNVA